VFCPFCGEKLREVKNDEKKMGTVTSAIRSNKASEENKERKHHQQGWGLFETNYQREKGINVQSSMKEIDDYEQEGKLPSLPPKRKPTVGGKFRGALEEVLHDDEEEDENGGGSFYAGGIRKSGALIQGVANRLSKTFGNRPMSLEPRSSIASSRSIGSTASAGNRPSLRTARKEQIKDDFEKKIKRGGSQGVEFFEKFQQQQKAKFCPGK